MTGESLDQVLRIDPVASWLSNVAFDEGAGVKEIESHFSGGLG
jgi:hypothetical protein